MCTRLSSLETRLRLTLNMNNELPVQWIFGSAGPVGSWYYSVFYNLIGHTHVQLASSTPLSSLITPAVLLITLLINLVVNKHNKMVSSKNARKILLPSFENAPSFDSADFFGLYTTLSASFTKAQLWSKYLRHCILCVYAIRSPWKPK